MSKTHDALLEAFVRSDASPDGKWWVDVTKADKFRALRETNTFADESAVLVAVEPGASSVGTVGNLLAYRELVRADWGWTVEELLLVSDEDSEHVNHVCRELGVRAIRVT
ncbi:MAG: hypothetical protein V5A55_14855 [Halovenus sp.]